MSLTWLPAVVPDGIRYLILNALADVGEHEIPYGSNRGPWVDRVVQAAGSPLGSAWCGCAVRDWLESSGYDVPDGAGEADAWRRWGIAKGEWHEVPVLGAVACYSSDGILCHHVELVVGIDVAIPVMTIGGNTTLDGMPVTGEIVTLKTPKAHPTMTIVGFVWPA